MLTLASLCATLDVSAAGVTERAAELSTSTYDALNPKGKRKAPSATTMHEDRHLVGADRRRLIGGVRELRRNSSFLGWMVRRHLDYVTAARFESVTGNEDWDRQMEARWPLLTEPPNTEVRAILDLEEFVRIAEAMAVLDGDFGTVAIETDVGLVQGIASDRIADPTGRSTGDGVAENTWYNGVRVDPTWGRPVEYAIAKRASGWSGLTHERTVSAEWFHLHAYLGSIDQYRGVSPVAEAYNQLRDLYEAEDLAMVRSKISSLFALAITRNADKAIADLTESDEGTYEVDFAGKPIFLDLNPGDDAKFLDSDNPGANLQEFWTFVSMVALKALDIPYGMFDESRANFFGNKTAWLAYDRACEAKRARVIRLRNAITAHKYRSMIRAGTLKLPAGVTVESRPWRWVPRKMPWWRPLEEVTANLKAIGGGLTTPQRVCQESDQGDWYENIDDIAKAQAYAAKRGVRLSFEVPADLTTAVAPNRAP